MTFLPLLALISAQLPGGYVETAWEWTGPAPYLRAAKFLASGGDLSGDGWRDFLVGAPTAHPNGLASGSLFVLNGADGSTLRRFDGREEGGYFGTIAAMTGDLSGDLVPDILVGAPGDGTSGRTTAGSALLISGRTGSTLARWDGLTPDGYFGGSLAAGSDLTGDGIPDFAIGDGRHTQGNRIDAGRFIVVSGATRSIVLERTGGAYYYTGGFLAIAPDLDGDGVSDLLFTEGQSVRSLVAYSVVRSAEIWRTNAADNYWTASVLPISDLDGDLHPDLLVGCPVYYNVGGFAAAISGATGAEIRRIASPLHDGYGAALCLAGDWDGDLVEDVAIGAPWAEGVTGPNEGLIEIRSLVTTALLGVITTAEAVTRFGGALAHGELDATGRRPINVGSELSDYRGWVDTGSVRSFNYRSGLEGDQDEIRASVQEDLVFDIDFPAEYAQHGYQLLISATGTGVFSYGVDVPLTLDSMVLRTLANRFPPPIQTIGTRGVLDADGNSQARLLIPAGLLTAAIGRTPAAAAIVIKPFGATAVLSSMAWPFLILP